MTPSRNPWLSPAGRPPSLTSLHAAKRWQAEADRRAKAQKLATSVAIWSGVLAAFFCVFLPLVLTRH